MSANVLATVGMSDVQIVTDDLKRRYRFPRDMIGRLASRFGREVHNFGYRSSLQSSESAWDKTIDLKKLSSNDATFGLCFPLLERGITRVLEDSAREDNLQIHRIVLFNTKRTDPTYSQGEPTIFSKVISCGLKTVLGAKLSETRFEEEYIVSEGEISRGMFLGFFEKWFRDHSKRLCDEADKIFIFPSGGIPAMGNALTILSTVYLPRQKFSIYEQPERRNDETGASRVPDYLGAILERHAICAALDKSDFHLARRFFESGVLSKSIGDASVRELASTLRYLDLFIRGENAVPAKDELAGVFSTQGTEPPWFKALAGASDSEKTSRVLALRLSNAIEREDTALAAVLLATLVEVLATEVLDSQFPGVVGRDRQGEFIDLARLSDTGLKEAAIAELSTGGREIAPRRVSKSVPAMKVILSRTSSREGRDLTALISNTEQIRLRRNEWIHEGISNLETSLRSSSVFYSLNILRRLTGAEVGEKAVNEAASWCKELVLKIPFDPA